MDLDGIVDDFLDAVIISFVEEEKGLYQIEMIESSERKSTEELINDWGSVRAYNAYRDAHLTKYKKLSEIYTWVKSGRAIVKKALDDADQKRDYLVSEKIEKEIYDKNTEYYGELIRLRGYLWT